MFAGGGTVGIESFVKSRNFILIDINPLLPELIKLKTWTKDINFSNLNNEVNEILKENKNLFFPEWNNINYWYHPEILNFLANLWGNLYKKKFKYHLILKFALLYISKKFSYADDKVPKLYSSKKKKKEILELLQSNIWKDKIKNEFIKRVNHITNSIHELNSIIKTNKSINYDVITGDSYQIDTSSFKSIDLIITSPPYLQAQEYIRSIKLDLYWSGYKENKIKELSKLEIPYRKISQSERINSNILNKFREKLNIYSLEKKKQNLFESYFYYTIKSIERFLPFLKENGKVCIFVGSPKFNGVEVNIWEVLLDYFSESLKLINILADPIINRKLGYKRKNNNPNGMDYEYLLIFEKKSN